MTPVTIGNATLHLGDCREILPSLAKVDCVITDPPYLHMQGGTALSFDSGVTGAKAARKTVADPWQANLDWVLPAWELAERAFFSFCSYHFVADLRVAVPSKPTALISWYQRNAAPSAAMAPQFQTEYCWAFRKGTGLDWRKLKTHIDIPRLQTGCMAVERLVDAQGSALHPTQKPIKLIEALLKVGQTSVLDCFMGTGTTGVACINLGRSFVGIEREPKYFDIACTRIENAQRQAKLFEPEPVAKPVNETLFSEAA